MGLVSWAQCQPWELPSWFTYYRSSNFSALFNYWRTKLASQLISIRSMCRSLHVCKPLGSIELYKRLNNDLITVLYNPFVRAEQRLKHEGLSASRNLTPSWHLEHHTRWNPTENIYSLLDYQGRSCPGPRVLEVVLQDTMSRSITASKWTYKDQFSIGKWDFTKPDLRLLSNMIVRDS